MVASGTTPVPLIDSQAMAYLWSTVSCNAEAGWIDLMDACPSRSTACARAPNPPHSAVAGSYRRGVIGDSAQHASVRVPPRPIQTPPPAASGRNGAYDRPWSPSAQPSTAPYLVRATRADPARCCPSVFDPKTHTWNELCIDRASVQTQTCDGPAPMRRHPHKQHSTGQHSTALRD